MQSLVCVITFISIQIQYVSVCMYVSGKVKNASQPTDVVDSLIHCDISCNVVDYTLKVYNLIGLWRSVTHSLQQ